jgi:hypothetical protein
MTSIPFTRSRTLPVGRVTINRAGGVEKVDLNGRSSAELLGDYVSPSWRTPPGVWMVATARFIIDHVDRDARRRVARRHQSLLDRKRPDSRAWPQLGLTSTIGLSIELGRKIIDVDVGTRGL